LAVLQGSVKVQEANSKWHIMAHAAQVMFVPPSPVHPHIYSNGHICLDILYDGEQALNFWSRRSHPAASAS
jgi:ubiquitin-protein ligase